MNEQGILTEAGGLKVTIYAWCCASCGAPLGKTATPQPEDDDMQCADCEEFSEGL